MPNNQAGPARHSGLNSGQDSQAQYSGQTGPSLRSELRPNNQAGPDRPDNQD